MSVLIAQERDTYEQMWQVPAYAAGSPGENYARVFLEMAGLNDGVSTANVLDAGTGTGRGALALAGAGLTPWLADLTFEGLDERAAGFQRREVALWNDLRQSFHGVDLQYVYCCDVLEHIPTEFTMLTIARLLEVCTVGAFFSINLQPDVMGAWVGKALHQTVREFVWWRDRLSMFGELVEARDLMAVGLYYVRPR